MNKVILLRRLTKDPELRRTASGTAVTSFTLAVNKPYKTNGEQTADFISCVVWNGSAENVAKYCSKGSLVALDGRISTRNYINQNEQKVYVTEVICDSVQFIETKKKDAQNVRTEPTNDFMNGYDDFELQDDDLAF